MRVVYSMQYIAKTKSVKSKTQNHSSKFKIRIKKEVRSNESDVGRGSIHRARKDG